MFTEAIERLEGVIATSEHYDREPDDQAHDLLRRVRESADSANDVTVAVFAGATGSGKSSLVNAVVGDSVAHVAPTRPTTSTPLAVSARDVSPHLDMLDVSHRYLSPSVPDDLILVDLPDIDSTEETHRYEATRLINQADVLVWVLDPQKYADAVIHDDYLRTLTEHVDVMIILVNQIDKVPDSERDEFLRDVSALLEREGVMLEVSPVSAVTGEGVSELRERLAQMAAEKKARAERLTADIRTYAKNYQKRIEREGGSTPNDAQLPVFDSVAHHIARGAGAHIVIDAAGASYRQRAKKATRWPLTRWIGAKTDPLERLHLRGKTNKDTSTLGESVVGASSVRASEEARISATVAIRRYSDEVTSCLPRTWQRTLRKDARAQTGAFLDSCDQAIHAVDLRQSIHPLWWRLVNFAQWISTICALAGLVWILLIHAGQWLTIVAPDPPMVSIFSLPSLMLIGGLALSLLLSLTSAVLMKQGGRRLRRRITHGITFAITTQARQYVLAPLEKARHDYSTLHENLTALASFHL